MQVTPQPAPLLLAGRDDGDARPAQIRGQAHPAHREPERTSELIEDLAIAGADRGTVGPTDDQSTDDLVAMTQQDLAVMCRVGPDRRNPLPAAGRHEVDRHRVEAELPFETDHECREQVVTGIGADVVDDALDDAQRVVARAVDEAIDETLDPTPGGFGDQGDGTGGGNEEPRRTRPTEHAPEPADEAGVQHHDSGGQHHPFETAMRGLLEPRRRMTKGLDDRPGDEQWHRRQEHQRRDDVAAGECPVDDVEAGGDDRQPSRHGPGQQPAVERITGRPAIAHPATSQQDDAHRSDDGDQPGARSRQLHEG